MTNKLTIQRNGEVIEIESADELRRGDFIPRTNLGPARYAENHSNGGRNRHTFYVKSEEFIDEIHTRRVRIEKGTLNIDIISETRYHPADKEYGDLREFIEGED